MAAKHWLMGCGVGCGVILLICLALIVGGGFFVRDTMKGFNDAVESREVIDERYGETRAFTPWSDGAVPPDRMESFLAVREATAPARDKLTSTFDAIPMSEEKARELESRPFFEKMRSVFGIVGSAMGLGAQMGEFFDARNKALIEHEMGMGEYSYIYAVAYYGWLGHSPDDGPESASVDTRSGEIKIGSGERRRRGMGSVTSQRVHDDLLQQLRNLLETLPAQADDPWRDRLSAEVSRLEQEPGGVPWQEGLPEQISASLAPYADRLEASYNPVSNAFELLRNRRDGKFSVHAE